MRALRWVLTIAAATMVAAAPAAADWLVMRDTSRVQTKGPWEVRGPMVVFTLPNGTLGSVRAADVDLPASEAATDEAAQPPQQRPTPEPPKKPVVVITDADVRHVDDPPAPATTGGSPAPAEASAPAAASTPSAAAPAAAASAPTQPERIKPTEWHEETGAKEGVTLVGQITNVSADFVQDIKVVASLFDEKGELIANADALLGAKILLAGQGTNFRVTFPGVYHYSSVKFDVKGFARKSAAPASGA
jgi:hypothetical protein